MDDRCYQFGDFVANPRKRSLSRNGHHLVISTKALDALMMLIEADGQTVNRWDLIDAIWPDTAVEDNNLTQQISALRKAFGEPSYIQTVPGRGYRFVEPVDIVREVENDVPREVKSRLPVYDRASLRGHLLASAYIVLVLSPFFFSYISHKINGTTQSLAVMQFRSTGTEEFIGTGISDTLRARLGSVEDIAVRSTSKSIRDEDIASIGRTLNVDTIITGSVQTSDERLRVTVEVVDAGTGRIVWGNAFDGSRAAMFELQDVVALEVARAFRSGIRN